MRSLIAGQGTKASKKNFYVPMYPLKIDSNPHSEDIEPAIEVPPLTFNLPVCFLQRCIRPIRFSTPKNFYCRSANG